MSKRNYLEVIIQSDKNSYADGCKHGKQLVKIFKKDVKFNFNSYLNGVYESYMNTLQSQQTTESDDEQQSLPKKIRFNSSSSFGQFSTSSAALSSSSGFSLFPKIVTEPKLSSIAVGKKSAPYLTFDSDLCPINAELSVDKTINTSSLTSDSDQPKLPLKHDSIKKMYTP
jgi:hypothetical protein